MQHIEYIAVTTRHMRHNSQLFLCGNSILEYPSSDDQAVSSTIRNDGSYCYRKHTIQIRQIVRTEYLQPDAASASGPLSRKGNKLHARPPSLPPHLGLSSFSTRPDPRTLSYSDVDRIRHRSTLPSNNLATVRGKLQVPLPGSSVGQQEASLIHILAVHEVDSLVDGTVNGLLLGRGIAIATGGRVLVVDMVDVAGDDSAGVVVRLLLDEMGYVGGDGCGGADGCDAVTDDGGFFADAEEDDGVCDFGAVCTWGVSFYQDCIHGSGHRGFDRSGRDHGCKVQEESEA